jgi:hypothetical protein
VRRLIALALPLALLTAGCSSSGSPGASPSATPSESASPTATDAPELTLARLAALSARSSYSASYKVTGAHPGVARIVRAPTGYSFQLTTSSGRYQRTASLIRTPSRTVSCTLLPKPVTCLVVAGPGKPVPSVFDAGLQHVFSDYLVTLSRHGSEYAVTTAVAGTGDGQCFVVRVTGSPAPGAVAAGTYCFAADGLPTRVSYPSGDLVLTKRGPAPKGSDFTPPVTPKPLP